MKGIPEEDNQRNLKFTHFNRSKTLATSCYNPRTPNKSPWEQCEASQENVPDLGYYSQRNLLHLLQPCGRHWESE